MLERDECHGGKENRRGIGALGWEWGGQGAGLPFSHRRQSGAGRAMRTSGRGAKAGAVLAISVGRRGSERERVSEQLVRGLTSHCKDFGLDPDMLRHWKWTCSDLDVKRLALAEVWRTDCRGSSRSKGGGVWWGEREAARRLLQDARWEMTDQGRSMTGLGHL